MQKFRYDPDISKAGYPIIGKNSEDISPSDAVYADTNGFLALITTSSRVLGYATDDVTMASDNQTVDAVKPSYVPALGIEMVYGSDQDCVQTDIGAYADMGTVSSNGFELNLSAGSSGQFFVLGFDPDEEADDDAVVVEVAEPQFLAFAQA